MLVREGERGKERGGGGKGREREFCAVVGLVWLARLNQTHTTYVYVCGSVVAIQTSILVYHNLIPDPKATLA